MWQRRTLSDTQSGGYLRARHPVPTTLCDQRQAGVPQAYQPLSVPGTSYVIASWGASWRRSLGPPSAHAERRTSTRQKRMDMNGLSPHGRLLAKWNCRIWTLIAKLVIRRVRWDSCRSARQATEL